MPRPVITASLTARAWLRCFSENDCHPRSIMSNTDEFATLLYAKVGGTGTVPSATLSFINTWASCENTKSTNNPLASEWVNDSTQFNSSGVQNYPTIEIGAQATASDLLKWPQYAVVVGAIKSGGPFYNCIAAINFWGTTNFADKIAVTAPLTNNYNSPGITAPEDNDLTPEQDQKLTDIWNSIYSPVPPAGRNNIDIIRAQLVANGAPENPPDAVTPAPS